MYGVDFGRTELLTATVKGIELAAFMDQAGSDYVLAGRVVHTGSIVLTHAVGTSFRDISARFQYTLAVHSCCVPLTSVSWTRKQETRIPGWAVSPLAIAVN